MEPRTPTDPSPEETQNALKPGSPVDPAPADHRHYFDADPSVPSHRSAVELSLPDMSLELTVDRGVFSARGVDPGTLELLKVTGRDYAPLPGEGDLLDLGCGYGPIACVLARRHPDRVVWAVDVNRRALALAAANASELGLANVRVRAPGEVPPAVRLAGMWSNPPIRVGKDALHAILLEWLARLEPAAMARLVVHRHLGADSLAAWLGQQGWAVSRLASKRGYRILVVSAA
jgi:16S rRNA (guanine1207-N2)-methyltransferase